MKPVTYPVVVFLALLNTAWLGAQTGPFSPENWPATRDPAKTVHYVATDGTFAPPGDTWVADDLLILNGGDDGTQDYTIGGQKGKKVTGNYLSVADSDFAFWQDQEFIDILVQVYGDASLFNAQGQPRNFSFLTGTLPTLNFPVGGQIPVEARNKLWNWVLFRIPNALRPDGTRFVGTVPAGAQGNTAFGGVNGGTIRFEGVPNLIVRVVAFGQQGAFGEPADINKFASSATCDPEPNTNLAGIDFNRGVTNHIQVLNNLDQTVTYADSVGPADDLRRAVRPDGLYLNFGITDNYLGKPCNDPRAVKLGLEFYDDPAFAGLDVRFGPETYATDDKGGTATYPVEKRQLLTGSGKWIRRSWTVPAVSLAGISTGSLTGGPRLISENGQVFISAFYIAVLRIGSHPLAGQDPLSDWYEDLNICTDAYGSFAELDLVKDLRNGLDTGSSSGDQEMITAEAGPANDRRQAIRPAREDGTPGYTHQNLNFAITGEALGPSSQPPARLAICVTYYDDPQLAGKQFKPEVYWTVSNGVDVMVSTPSNFFVTLEGTDKWRDAYWEISDMKFNGVNQGPQAAARFVLNDKIFFTRVQYAVIRPCGPNAGKNALESFKPTDRPRLAIAVVDTNSVQLTWPISFTTFTLQSSAGLGAAQWQAINAAPTVQNNLNVITLQPTNTVYYRLTRPW